MSVNSKGSGKLAFMCRLAGAFAGHLYDKLFSHVLSNFNLVVPGKVSKTCEQHSCRPAFCKQSGKGVHCAHTISIAPDQTAIQINIFCRLSSEGPR